MYILYTWTVQWRFPGSSSVCSRSEDTYYCAGTTEYHNSNSQLITKNGETHMSCDVLMKNLETKSCPNS